LGLDNVHPLQRAWEDDWSDVPVCGILIASRSGLVEDLDTALEKTHRRLVSSRPGTRSRGRRADALGFHRLDFVVLNTGQSAAYLTLESAAVLCAEREGALRNRYLRTARCSRFAGSSLNGQPLNVCDSWTS